MFFSSRRSSSLLLSATLFLTAAGPASAQQTTQSFKDVPPEHPAYEAAEFLKSAGIISGYADGTFKPDRKVNRAEALKIIVAPLVKPEQLATLTVTTFEDIAPTAWYLPYAEAARMNTIVDGPPAKPKFLGENPVIKAEFLKMLELAYKVDPLASFSDIALPPATDVASTSDWFYPYMRYALASSMIMISTEGDLNPARELTRGDTALLLHRFIMYQQGRRTQALLSEAENEIIITLNMLEADNVEQADFASARALIAARGAHLKRSSEPVVQGAVKIAEAFRSLVNAYKAGKTGNLDGVISLAGDAWNSAAKALSLSPTLKNISEQVQILSKNMADSARAAKAAPAQQ
ncbi:MAG: S-layer homology domain-containing protein [Candidatus Peribacteraceae bacterium]|nr:S-layer homology domain-containing protein [Candidatus Peribacteraceae bacterium]